MLLVNKPRDSTQTSMDEVMFSLFTLRSVTFTDLHPQSVPEVKATGYRRNTPLFT